MHCCRLPAATAVFNRAAPVPKLGSHIYMPDASSPVKYLVDMSETGRLNIIKLQHDSVGRIEWLLGSGDVAEGQLQFSLNW